MKDLTLTTIGIYRGGILEDQTPHKKKMSKIIEKKSFSMLALLFLYFSYLLGTN